MKISDQWWRNFELDLQTAKLGYLYWIFHRAWNPNPEHLHLFNWEEYGDKFCPIHSRYGRAFSISPFGSGIRGVKKPTQDYELPGLNTTAIELRSELTGKTQRIRNTIKECIYQDSIDEARNVVLNFYWLKLAQHELLFDRAQYGWDQEDKRVKGRFGLDESEKWTTVRGVRNRIVNAARFGEYLEDGYVRQMDTTLQGLSRKNSQSTFLRSCMSWDRYAMCAYDTGPIIYGTKGFVHFSEVKARMNLLGWPYQSTAKEVIRPLYTIGLDYRRPPIRLKGKPTNGYSLKSLLRRKHQILKVLDNLTNEINRLRNDKIG